MSEIQQLAALEELPEWYRPLLRGVVGATPEQLVRLSPPAGMAVRESSVLVLMSDGVDHGRGPDVLIIERAANMRSHGGQPAFPGGATEPEDETPVATALREAVEETGVQPSGIVATATLPRIWVPPSGFAVTPVLGWWREPSPVDVRDPIEVAAVHRALISDLVDPANRVHVSHPSGYVGPGFDVCGLLVWGFTGMLLDRLLSLAGWSQPWEKDAPTVPFDEVLRQGLQPGLEP